jgi:hypothetical protein
VLVTGDTLKLGTMRNVAEAEVAPMVAETL